MLYADDMQLYLSCDIRNINAAVNNMNNDLMRLHVWCRDHGLVLNISKCKPMIIGYSRLMSNLDHDNLQPIVIENNELSYEKSVIKLGLRMNSNFNWSEQVDYIHRRVY